MAENRKIQASYLTHDGIIFQSEFCRDVYHACGFPIRPHRIIHNGVPEEFTPHGPRLEDRRQRWGVDKVLIASASWRRHKRLEELVVAMGDPRLANVCLLVLGGYEYQLNQEVPPNVYKYPRVHSGMLPNLYRSADAMVHLSWLDWCPNTVVEALACGLPVLCSHNGGTRELLKGQGKVVELEEDYELGTMIDLYNPPEVDTETIVQGILEVLEMPKSTGRPDLAMSRVAEDYWQCAMSTLSSLQGPEA